MGVKKKTFSNKQNCGVVFDDQVGGGLVVRSGKGLTKVCPKLEEGEVR